LLVQPSREHVQDRSHFGRRGGGINETVKKRL
jgi:hypothetical protein